MNIIEFIKQWFKKIKNEDANESNIETSDVAQSDTIILVNYELAESDTILENVSIGSGYYPIFLANLNDEAIVFEETQRSDKEGLLEDFFFDFLSDIKGYRFRNDIKIRIKERFSTPDFCLPEANLVIEIDEPYTSSDGKLKPIHYIGCDDVRNKVFVENGWQVIRFAEEQIAKYPIDCCNFIVSMLSKQHFDIEKVAQWTYSDSENMIQNNFRNTYLPIEFKGVSGISKYSLRSLPIKSIKKHTDKEGERYVIISVKVDKFPKKCRIPEKDFIISFVKTDFFVESKFKTNEVQYVLNFIHFTSELTNNEQDFLLGMRLEAYGEIKDKFFNLKSYSDFRLDIPEDNTLRWSKYWDDIRQRNIETLKRRF